MEALLNFDCVEHSIQTILGHFSTNTHHKTIYRSSHYWIMAEAMEVYSLILI